MIGITNDSNSSLNVAIDTLNRLTIDQGGENGGRVMHALVKRRLTVATCWAVARISALDALQSYEESYGLTEEFREWILCFDQHPELLEDSVLMAPAPATLELLLQQAVRHPHDQNNDDLLEI